ncbi:hypothetical protein [Streptomyces parvulus]|uniref:hypothetical protein n=1 Tax=Streptomyces parvulus TaxID=146923 RepID=UPI0036A72557
MKPPSRATRHALPVLLAALLLPLAGCGIPETGVVQAGEPASGVLEPGAAPSPSETAAVPLAKVRLFFVADGLLAPVTRVLPAATDPGAVVLVLLDGPDQRERASGLTTELPSATAAPAVRVDGASVTVLLPRGTRSLGDTAVDQLACTVAAARLRQDPALESAQVTVEQPGGRLAGRSSEDCPMGAEPAAGGTGGGGGVAPGDTDTDTGAPTADGTDVPTAYGTDVPTADGTDAPSDGGTDGPTDNETGAPGRSGDTGTINSG